MVEVSTSKELVGRVSITIFLRTGEADRNTGEETNGLAEPKKSKS
jgi:hypothetical protein